MRRTRVILLGILSVVALLATACGDDEVSSGGSGDSKDKGSITVGSADFGEAEIIANMYAAVLEKDGYTISEKYKVGARDVYVKAMQSGEIDVVPEYIGTLTEFLNVQLNGQEAAAKTPLASGDPGKTQAALEGIAAKAKLGVTKYSPAIDSNAFAVTKETADTYGLSKLSDLAKPDVVGKLVLGGPPECPKRPFCLPGLQKTYAAKFKGELKKLDAGGPKTIGALKDGTIDIGLVFSSDGAVAAENLVVLSDDKQLQTADNITALFVPSKVDADAQKSLDEVNAALTTEKLQELNKSFNVDKEDAADLAKTFLEDNNLL